MIVILAMDGLEQSLVVSENFLHLLQDNNGKTNIEEFSESRTIILWSSFLTGKNKEKEILALGKQKMWDVKQKTEETFLKFFSKPNIIDIPGYAYEKSQHDKERQFLKTFFEAEPEKREEIRKKYNDHAFQHHRKVKEEFFTALKGDHDIVICYFNLPDVIGHLNMGNKSMMKMIYHEMNDIAKETQKKIDDPLLILSDHGMVAIGEFGDHSKYGFWSTNFPINKERPKLTDFYDIIKNLKENS